MMCRRSLPLYSLLVGLTIANADCKNQQECTLNSDCLPGRFCSQQNFCEFQCRRKEDCENCGLCDLRYGVCIKSEPASFTALATCCTLTDKPVPQSSPGVCLADADGGSEPESKPEPAGDVAGSGPAEPAPQQAPVDASGAP